MDVQTPPADRVMGPMVPRWRLDPTGRIAQPEVPDGLLQRWRDDRAAFQAEAAEAVTRHAAEVRTLSGQICELRGLVMDAYMVANDLRGLVYLFEKALTEDGADSELTTASHIVIDCIRTMAARLDALETRASATREDGGEA